MTASPVFRVADLSSAVPQRFDLRPESDLRATIAAELDLSALRKLSFVGEIRPAGKRDWKLVAKLGATVVQPCVVTLDPVTTRLDTDVRRLFCAKLPETNDEEVEMPDDDTIEPLGDVINVQTVMTEALALALPLYPRASGAELGEAVFAAPDVAPMRDEDARPFAALSQLRDQLVSNDPETDSKT